MLQQWHVASDPGFPGWMSRRDSYGIHHRVFNETQPCLLLLLGWPARAPCVAASLPVGGHSSSSEANRELQE
jgi:hypothetical protein